MIPEASQAAPDDVAQGSDRDVGAGAISVSLRGKVPRPFRQRRKQERADLARTSVSERRLIPEILSTGQYGCNYNGRYDRCESSECRMTIVAG